MILKPTCTANGTWVTAPPPKQDLPWLERQNQSKEQNHAGR
jgi:hypothetical protein